MGLLNAISRLLLFKMKREEILQFDRSHFAIGLVATWLVGMGRYWDDPGASLLQHLGLGSVIYIFLLATFIWMILLPFRIENWNYFTVLTFISLTSFPAVFYAIPVERFTSIDTANTINVCFLAIVAFWRLALLYQFLKVFTRLPTWNIVVVSFMPICLIIATLTILNLHRVVFNVMGGLREPSAHDGTYFILLILTGASLILSIPLVLGYIVAVYQSRKTRKQ